METPSPDIELHIKAYYFDGGDKPDPLGRYRSWEECFNHFSALRAEFPGGNGLEGSSEKNAALHLGFYLASWGMFRGSSNLMEHSYLIHIPAVRILLESGYGFLMKADPTAIRRSQMEQTYCDGILDLQARLKAVYDDGLKQRDPVSLTDTLLTKILLGTLACTPAYDNFFKSGLARAGLKPQSRLEYSLREVLQFYQNHERDFEKTRLQLDGAGISYPPMKLVDMSFWQLGQPAPPPTK